MLGLLMGGGVIYWFTGASTQAVSVAPDGRPLRVNKATPWKTAYHITRALLFTVDTLRGS